MKRLTMLLIVFLSIFIAAPSIVFADNNVITINGPHTVTEGNGVQVTFTISLDHLVDAGTITVDCDTVDGTAITANGDYSSKSDTLSFGVGEQSKQFVVDILNDTAVENQENFTVVLSNEQNTDGTISVNGSPATCNVNDNDAYAISISGSPSVVEGTQALFTVTVSPEVQTGDTVTVQYSTSDGSALAPGDYGAESNTVLTFNGGDSTLNATVDTNDDAIVENGETFTVTLNGPTTTNGSVSIAGPGPQTGTITDNDAYAISISGSPSVVEGTQALFTVTVSPEVQTGDTVTVQYSTSDGSALAPGDYGAESNTVLTFNGGDSTLNATVDTNDDAIVENGETFTVTLNGPTTTNGSVSIAGPGPQTGTITDNDAYAISISGSPSVVEGTQALFTVTVSPEVQTGDTVTVQYSTSDGSALAPGDYGAESNTVLTFNGGDSTLNATVDTNDDAIVENGETFTVTLNGPTTTNGSVSIAGPGPQTGTITDNDAYAISISGSPSVVEGTQALFTVTVSPEVQTGDTVTVQYSTSDGSALAPGDYGAESNTVLTFNGGDSTLNATVDTNDDAIVENGETFTVTLNGPTTTNGSVSIAGPGPQTGTITDNDAYAISISGSPSVVEGTQALFTVTVSPEVQTGDTVTVQYSTSDGSALAPGDYGAESNTVLTFNGGDSTLNATVDTNDDAIVENGETFTVTLNGPTTTNGSVSIAGPGPQTGTITDNDAYAISISGSPSVVEGTQALFTVTVSPEVQTGDTVTVQYSTSDGSALAPGDYGAESNTVLTFNGGDSTLNATVDTNDDAIVENGETFTVTLNGPTTTNGSVSIAGPGPQTGTITDNDAYAISISGSPSVVEGTQALFTVTVSPEVQTGDTVTVQYSTSDGSALAPGDYGAESNTVLTFNGGDSTLNATVDTNDDAIVENGETFTVTLNGPTTTNGSVSIAGPGPQTGTITDNDAYAISISGSPSVVEGTQALFTVTVSPEVQTGDTVTVQYSTSDGSALAPGDYGAESNTVLTFNGGDSTLNATVDTNDDAIVENGETFTVTLNGPTTTNGSVSIAGPGPQTGTITDNDAYAISISGSPSVVEGTQALFTVTVSPEVQTGDTVTVQYSTSDGSALAPGDYGAESNTVLTFNGGDSTLNATVDTNDDAIVENGETFTVTLNGPTTTNGSVSIAGPGPQTGTIQDDGADTYGIAIDSPAAVVEDNTNISFTVTLSNVDPTNGVSGTVHVDYDTSDVTALDGDDYTGVSGTLTFNIGDGANKTIDVAILEDSYTEDIETFQVLLSNFDGGGSIGGPGIGTITDDGDKYNASLEASKSVVEDVGTVTFSVTLDQPAPPFGITVSYTTVDIGEAAAGSDYNTVSGDLIFTPGDTTRDIVITINQDTLYEEDEDFQVTITPDANGAESGSPATCTITNDGDTYDVSIETAETVIEGTDATVTFTVTLDQEVSGGTSVSFTLDEITAVLGSDYAVNTLLPTLNFAANETTKDIVVNIINDDMYEVPETFEVNITCADPNATLSNGKGTCTINDDGIDTYSVSVSAVPVPNPVLEEDTTVIFTVTLDQEVPGGASVAFSFNDVTATLGSDYSENTGSPLNFGAGETTKDIVVNILNDQVDEDSETFEIIITSGDSNAIIGNDTGTGTITDNDYTVTFNIATVGPGPDGGRVNGVLLLDQVVDHGTDCVQVTATPNAGYRFVEWTGDYNGTVNPLTITNVTSDMTITANFIAIYTITATVTGGHGTISPSGAVIVDYGTSQTFTIDPDTCYEIFGVSVDGSSLDPLVKEYTFTNVTEDHTIDAAFIEYDCTITATAEYGGTMLPVGSMIVSCGSSKTFTITPGAGNAVEDVLVDGLSVGAVTSYTFSTPIEKDDPDGFGACAHSIVAKFTRLAASCMEISDIPLTTLINSAPANIMFVMDDSGSMDFEVMTTEDDGLFHTKTAGVEYLFDMADNMYHVGVNSQVLSGDDRQLWQSQWVGINKVYYDPTVYYEPWISLTNAPLDVPWSQPMYNNASDPFLNLSGTYVSIDAGIVVDNLDGAPYFTTTGTWDESDMAPAHDGSSVLTTNSGDTATFTPNIPTAGDYDVYAWWNCYNDRDENAEITIVDSVGTYTVNRDQRSGGADGCGEWVLLDTYNFAAGTSGSVTIGRHALSTGSSTVADAVKFVKSGISIDIKNAHYYIWSASLGKPYLVVVDNGNIDYYAVNDSDSDNKVEDGELTIIGSPPDDVIPKNESGTPRTYEEERQNFANWFSYYRRRDLVTRMAIGKVITEMSGVNIGFRGINGVLKQPVLKVKVEGEDNTSDLLNALYSYRLDADRASTPLRRGMEYVGQYFDQDDGEDGGVGTSPIASAEDGGECQQNFAVVFTDGYYNGLAPVKVGNEDGDNGPPYADNQPGTLADTAMMYYENDLADSLDNKVPANQFDDATYQHLVFYGITFGVHGTLNPDDYDVENCIEGTESDCPPWPEPINVPIEKIDDLWHAAVNGRGLFLSASNPQELIAAFLAVMENIILRIGSASSVSVNGDELYTKLSGNILMYQSNYDSDGWVGDVKAYQVCTELEGVCEGKEVGDVITSTYAWSANEKLESLDWDLGRNIVTYNGTDAGKPFRWGDDLTGLTATQKASLNNDSTLLDYLRGDTSNEKANDGTFRDRFARLGDIVHSSPVFENGVLYAGGNDGMLHAFAAADGEPYEDAVGGEELFAYVPNLIFNNLSQIADPAYAHKYFVDLTPTVQAGVDISGNTTTTTVLVGGLGHGGKGYYALDVTNPTDWTSETAVAGKVMWEYPKAGVTDDDMGYSYSKPVIVKSMDSSVGSNGWVVILGNGYNSQNGHAVLYILNPGTGDIINKIDTGVDGCNGLSSPVPIDVDYDDMVDYVYAGDLRGNVWKFDLTDTDYTNWEVAFYDGGEKPLFQAQGPGGTTQPITTKPDVMYHPKEHGYMVVFGTGQFLGEPDFFSTTVQSFYGIWDYGDDEDDGEYLGSFNRGFGHELSNQESTVTLLGQQVIPSESPDPNAPDFWTVTLTDGAGNPYDLPLRLTTNNEIVWETMDDPDGNQYMPDLSNIHDNHAGWYFDLPLSGEKGTVDVMLRNGNAIAISYRPDDVPCSAGGNSVIHEFSAETGARLTRPQFDINGDGVVDENDMINIGTDENPIWVVPTGIQLPGQIQPPAILIDPETGLEIKYLSSSSGTIEKVKEKAALVGITHWREFE